jgi:hypothetical protein
MRHLTRKGVTVCLGVAAGNANANANANATLGKMTYKELEEKMNKVAGAGPPPGPADRAPDAGNCSYDV